MSLPYVELVLQSSTADCGIAALAMLAGKRHEDVLTAAVTRKHPAPHKGGMTTRQIVQLAARLKIRLSLRRSWDLENDVGLLTVEKVDKQPDEFAQHIVLLKWGLVFDSDGVVLEPEFFFTSQGFRPVSLLVEEE